MNVMPLLRKRKGSVFFIFWNSMILSNSTDIFSELSKFICSCNLSGFCSKDLFFCCLLLINVNTACDLIPELLLTAALADIPAGTTLVWRFLKTRRVYCI